MHKMLVKDSSMCRAGLGDHIIAMRKPGENEVPIAKPYGLTRWIGPPDEEPSREDPETYSHHVWRKYASPVWNIRQSRTLHRKVKGKDDEKHLTPLQLDVSERCIELWSNPGETILSPFAGIGSEGASALRLGRKFLGIELKEEYCLVAKDNLEFCSRDPEFFANGYQKGKNKTTDAPPKNNKSILQFFGKKTETGKDAQKKKKAEAEYRRPEGQGKGKRKGEGKAVANEGKGKAKKKANSVPAPKNNPSTADDEAIALALANYDGDWEDFAYYELGAYKKAYEEASGSEGCSSKSAREKRSARRTALASSKRQKTSVP